MEAVRRVISGLLLLVAVLAGCSPSRTGTGPVGGPTSSSATTTPSTSTTTLLPSTTRPAAGAGRWSLIPDGPANVALPAAWTGRELLVAHGGCCGELGSVDLTGLDPSTGRWRQLPSPPLTPRTGAVGAWTGSEMVIAGGSASPDSLAEHATGATGAAAWEAATGTWHRISSMPAPLPVGGFATALWTGREMLVWASLPAWSDSTQRIPGSELVLAYDPVTDRWRRLPASGLTPRADPVVVWAGDELFVWGGLGSQRTSAYADGAILDPATGTWRRLPPAPVPARGLAAAVWTGSEVLIWGGATGPSSTSQVGQGAAYSPATSTWRALPLSPLRAKSSPAGIWTGRLFILLGGSAGPAMPVPGPGAAAYEPATNAWTTLPTAPDYPATDRGATGPASQRAGAIATWTGRSALFVGGLDFRQQGPRSDGLEWTPAG